MIILFGIECKLENKMEIDIKSIIVLLATQAMINMGEIQDPLTQDAKNDLDGASVFMQLLDVLELKTKGNLTPREQAFLVEVKDNLDQVYNKRLNAGN
jgi:hypothetical protein